MLAIQSPYDECPTLSGDTLKLRLVRLEDTADLLKCYSDPKAQQLFNADNCTNSFEYATMEEMRQAIEFWLDEYRRGYYVRFAIVDRLSDQAVGTIEMFTRTAKGDTLEIGVLRIDLRSDFEREAVLDELVCIIEAEFPIYFAYSAIVTKAPAIGETRREALRQHGFTPLTDRSIVDYDQYFIKWY